MKNDVLYFPYGGTKIYTIATVNITDTGVAVQNSRGDMVGWIETNSLNKKRRAAILVLEAMAAGKHFVQPDWDFLDDADEE